MIAAVMGVILFALNRIEAATDGWGMHGHFFDLSWFRSSSLVVAWLGRQTLLGTTGWLGLLTLACGGLTYATVRRIRA